MQDKPYEIKDLTIIGGGPTGLFGAFYAGMRGASARIVDALPALGGQLMALYPEKYIYDVAGFPKVLAKDLVRDMSAQALQFGADVHLNQVVTGLSKVVDPEGGIGHFLLETDVEVHASRTVLIAAGIGAFEPRKLPLKDVEQWETRGLYDRVLEPQQFAGQRVVIVGGGDSALDWTVNLMGIARSITLVHRRNDFRGHAATVRQVMEHASRGACTICTSSELHAIHGDERIERVTIMNRDTRETRDVEVDAVIPQLGFHSDLGAIREWGLDTEKADIKVDQVMSTNVQGIYAAGDITSYPGKLKLIAVGAGEACIAVNNAVHYIDPKAKVNPGHSSNLAIFGETE